MFILESLKVYIVSDNLEKEDVAILDKIEPGEKELLRIHSCTSGSVAVLPVSHGC
jgi:hypothetical protein